LDIIQGYSRRQTISLVGARVGKQGKSNIV